MRQHSRKAIGMIGLVFLLTLLAASIPQAQASQILQFQVSASTDDCTKYTTNQFSLTRTTVDIGTTTITYQDNGMRFLNVSIDSSYSLYYAKLIFTASATSSGTKASNIYMEDNVTPTTFTNLTDFNARTRNPMPISWTVPSITAEQEYEIDVTALVSIMTTNASWVSGNNMTFFWTNGAGTTLKRFYSYNGDSAKAPILEIKVKEQFWITYYTNTPMDHAGDNGICDYLNAAQISNGTQLQIYEGSYTHLYFALNSSYVFKNYTVIDDTTYYDNPLVWWMPENFGNATIWAYSEDSQAEDFSLGLAPGFLLAALIILPIGILIAKKH